MMCVCVETIRLPACVCEERRFVCFFFSIMDFWGGVGGTVVHTVVVGNGTTFRLSGTVYRIQHRN
jgi:hypothetical protein